MMLKAATIALGLSLGLAACATAQIPQGRPAPTSYVLEPLYAVEAGKTVLRIRVGSNGCTKKDDFRADVHSPGGEDVLVAFHRIRRDPCQSFAIGSTWLEFSYSELRINPQQAFSVDNPLIAWNGPGD